MRVQREVIGEERRVSAEQRLEPPAKPRIDDERLVAPEEPGMDEHEARARLDGLLEELARARDAAGDRRHFVRADDLKAGGRELRPPRDLQQLVRIADDLVAAGHRAIL